MNSQHHANHSSKEYVLMKTFLSFKGFGMTASKRRLGWSQRSLVNRRSENVKDPTRVKERVRI
jgi:hypothetical protein